MRQEPQTAHDPSGHSGWSPYLLATAIVVIVVGLRWLFLSHLGTRVLYVTLYPGVMIAALAGGLRGGLTATALSVLAALVLWVPPEGWLAITDPVDELAITIFLFCSVAVSIICEAMHRAQARARTAIAEAVRIHERREAQEASEQRFRSTLDSMLEGCQIIGFDWRVLYLNDVAAQYARRPKSELLGWTITEVYPVIRHTELLRAMQRCMESRKSEQIEDEIVYADGDRAWFRIDIQPAPEGLLIVSLEITDRKRNERERAELEDQLRHLQKLDAIGRTTLQVAHNFNSLIGVIRTQAELALDLERYGQPLAPSIRLIRQAVDQASEITQSLLTFSRVPHEAKTNLALAEVIADMFPLLRHSVPARIELTIEPAEECCCSVLGDLSQIQQMMFNLVLNARDAASGGGKIRIGVSQVRLSPPGTQEVGDYARIQVIDTGAGIPAKIHSQIFEPFVTSKSADRGTGLGLSIVHGIVRGHGGWIDVESEPGKGTTFSIMLPCAAKTASDGSACCQNHSVSHHQ